MATAVIVEHLVIVVIQAIQGRVVPGIQAILVILVIAALAVIQGIQVIVA